MSTFLKPQDIGRLDAVSSVDGASDKLAVWDASTGKLKAVTPNTLETYGNNEVTIQINSGERVGATAGWVNTGVNTGLMATLPESQTVSTLVVPVTGLPIGAVITAFSVRGQVESAGGAVTLDADMRKITAVVTGHTDASIGAITQVAVTADTLVTSSKTVTSSTVSNTQSFIVLITGTTAASTDIEINSITVTYTKP